MKTLLLLLLSVAIPAPNWQPHGQQIESDGTPSEITALAVPGTRRFYRVTFQPPNLAPAHWSGV